MAVQVKVLSFNIGLGAAATTVTVTPGFQTVAGILWWSGATTNSAYGSGHNLRGMGFFTSATDFRVVTTYDQDGAGTAITSCGHRTDSCIAEIGAADTFVGWADVQSINSTQVVFEILDAFVTNLYVTGIFIGGTGVAAQSGVFTAAGTAPTTQAISTGITEASVTFFLGGPHTADAPVVTVDSSLSFGFGVGVDGLSAKPCAMLGGGANDGSTSGATGSYAQGGLIFAMHPINPTSAPTSYAEYFGSTAASTGFTINWPARASAYRIHYLTISGLSAKVVEILTQTDTTTAIPATGLPSPAIGGIVISAGQAETLNATSTPAANEEWSVGAFTSTTERMVQIAGSRNGNTLMFCQVGAYTTACYVNGDPTGNALEALMNVQSIDSGGATFIMSDADVAQEWAAVLLLGDPAAAFMPSINHPILQAVNRASTY